MKVIFCFVAALALALAAPPQEGKVATVLRFDNDNIGVDGYNFGYETSNGIAHEESAKLKNVGTDHEGIAVVGSFKYVGPDGVTYTVTYTADENGFQPHGAHLPVA